MKWTGGEEEMTVMEVEGTLFPVCVGRRCPACGGPVALWWPVLACLRCQVRQLRAVSTPITPEEQARHGKTQPDPSRA